jgi:DUF971 family protein
VLEVEFPALNEATAALIFCLPFEFLRVYSPSAEVRGHGPGQALLQVGKRNVTVTALEPVGHYGVRPIFSDGHASGIYTWDTLYQLGQHQETLWADYLAQLAAAGASRDPL